MDCPLHRFVFKQVTCLSYSARFVLLFVETRLKPLLLKYKLWVIVDTSCSAVNKANVVLCYLYFQQQTLYIFSNSRTI